MTTIEKLNNVSHGTLRIVQSYSVALGDGVMFVPAYPNEFRGLQSCYPLMLFKDGTSGQFLPVALLGFEDGENLFLDGEGGWNAPYIPLMSQRGPLMIGFEDAEGEGRPTPVIAVDMAHPKVSQTDGEALFLEHGGYAPYLDRMTAIMEAIHEGHALSEALVTLLLDLNLVTPCDLQITQDDGATHQLAGLYMIDDEALLKLDEAGVNTLRAAGFLPAAYLMLASQSQLQSLLRRKTDRSGA